MGLFSSSSSETVANQTTRVDIDAISQEGSDKPLSVSGPKSLGASANLAPVINFAPHRGRNVSLAVEATDLGAIDFARDAFDQVSQTAREVVQAGAASQEASLLTFQDGLRESLDLVGKSQQPGGGFLTEVVKVVSVAAVGWAALQLMIRRAT